MIINFLLFMQIFSFYKFGHSLIGELTENLISNHTKFKLKSLNFSLKTESSWADSIRRNPKYNWVKPLHYIDTSDDPLNNKCSVNSFKGINLYSALINHTEKIINSSNNNIFVYNLKFFIHFYQDLFQPLHESSNKGGNKCKVNFLNSTTTLHRVWDQLIIKRRSREFINYSDYINYLLYKSKNFYILYPFNYKFWIKHNNKLNCYYVYNFSDLTLDLDYYNQNKIIIENLIIMCSINLGYIIDYFIDYL